MLLSLGGFSKCVNGVSAWLQSLVFVFAEGRARLKTSQGGRGWRKVGRAEGERVAQTSRDSPRVFVPSTTHYLSTKYKLPCGAADDDATRPSKYAKPSVSVGHTLPSKTTSTHTLSRTRST